MLETPWLNDAMQTHSARPEGNIVPEQLFATLFEKKMRNPAQKSAIPALDWLQETEFRALPMTLRSFIQ